VSEIIDFVWNFTNTPTLDEILTTGDLQTWNIQNIENINNESDSVSNNNTTTNKDINKLQEEKQSVGIYTDYESGKKYISDSSKKVVLFFHASRCPNCRQAEKDILTNKNTIDSNLIIIKVDYDTSSDLKKKYSITSQTSYVLLDSQGNSKKKTIWLTTLQEIEKFINN
jgi:thiol-disulfide isomerase/thioredoxin